MTHAFAVKAASGPSGRTSPDRDALRQTLLARAEEIAPRLRERTDACEAMGRVPDETVDELMEAGLLRAVQPARYGGAELGWDVVCEIDRILARGCASQAWVNNILSDHAQQLGTFPVEAQDEVWGQTPKARVCGSLEPTGIGRVVPGGVVFSGKHGFGSGIDHAQWVVCGGFRQDGDKRLGRIHALVPTKDIEILDDWRVLGLGGTGSKSFVVRDVFVPEHRILDHPAEETQPGPGTAVNSAAVYRLPRASSLSNAFAALSVGIAEACLDSWLDHTAKRTNRGISIAAQAAPQLAAAQSAAEIKAAEHLALGPIREVMRVLETGATPSPALLRETKLSAAYAAQLTRGAVQRLAAAAGARAMYAGNPIQRQLRDVQMATAHFSLNWDLAATGWATQALDARAVAP